MSNLYLTADIIGTETGGGSVTRNEVEAFGELSEERNERFDTWDRAILEPYSRIAEEPWKWDESARSFLDVRKGKGYGLCHGYAGTFSDTIRKMKKAGTKVVWTVAAHDLEESIKEHQWFYGSYPFTHMSDPKQFERYKQGYLDADVVICPSTYSAETMRKYGRTGPIEIIPHGCHLPESIHPLPATFSCGYIGAYGPDKGIVYLLKAWKKLAYKDAVLLLGGSDSVKPEVQKWVKANGGGNIRFVGWVDKISDFYNACSVYVQPSVTEGFGMEVLEAMAHGRPVICSEGAGASELLPSWYRFPIRNIDDLAAKIEQVKIRGGCVGIENGYPDWQTTAEQFTWSKIRDRYKSVWKGVLDGSSSN